MSIHEPDESSPYTRILPLSSILILSSKLCLGLSGGPFSLSFQNKNVNAFSSHLRATCPIHFIFVEAWPVIRDSINVPSLRYKELKANYELISLLH